MQGALEIMQKNKHIGMWACPRSRSTVIAQAFQRLDGCVVYDEPFIGPYRWLRKENYHWNNASEAIKDNMEKDHEKVIETITGDLPAGSTFSFQKLSTDEYLPEFGTDWIPKLDNFFLLRPPQDILLSLQKALNNQTFKKNEITEELVGMKALHSVFNTLSEMTGERPLVISSDDVMKNPRHTLEWLCNNLDVQFDEKMLSWKKELKDSALSESNEIVDQDSGQWYETLRNSQTFLPYKKLETPLPDDLKPILEECMPYYEQLVSHCHVFPE